MDQPGKVANPARGQLNRENSIPLSPCVPENLVSRDGFSRPVPRGGGKKNAFVVDMCRLENLVLRNNLPSL